MKKKIKNLSLNSYYLNGELRVGSTTVRGGPTDGDCKWEKYFEHRSQSDLLESFPLARFTTRSDSDESAESGDVVEAVGAYGSRVEEEEEDSQVQGLHCGRESKGFVEEGPPLDQKQVLANRPRLLKTKTK